MSLRRKWRWSLTLKLPPLGEAKVESEASGRSQREIVQALVVVLGARRALSNDLEHEREDVVHRSVEWIRSKLTEALTAMERRRLDVYFPVEDMRQACNRYLSATPESLAAPRPAQIAMRPEYFAELQELRRTFASCLETLGRKLDLPEATSLSHEIAASAEPSLPDPYGGIGGPIEGLEGIEEPGPEPPLHLPPDWRPRKPLQPPE
jgi:hypothetical protein